MAAEPIVARDRERARVVDLLDQTRSGRGRLVIISGEAGIGKTCLAGAMEASGNAEWDSEISRLCEVALLERDLPVGLRAQVLARLAQALV